MSRFTASAAAAIAAGCLLAPTVADARPTCGGEDGPCPTGDRVAFVGKFATGGPDRLAVKESPRSGAKTIRTVKAGGRALIVCQTTGSSASGPYGTSTVWDKLLHGGYISDTRVYTGSDGRVAPPCPGDSPAPSYGGDPFAYDDPGAWRGEAGCSGGYTKGAVALSRWLERRWPRATRTIGGYSCRPNTADTSQNSLHAEGRALDWMISASSAANRRTVSRFIRRISADRWKLGRAMGIQEVIWNRKIWTANYPTSGFRAYSGPNPHTDHVHIGMNRAGASKRTSFWR